MHETALKLAEKGQPVPASLFADQTSIFSSLRQGMVLLMLGIGICLALFLCGIKFWAVGIIPMFMGLGYLIGCAANLALQGGVKSADGRAVLAVDFSAVFAAVRCTAVLPR